MMCFVVTVWTYFFSISCGIQGDQWAEISWSRKDGSVDRKVVSPEAQPNISSKLAIKPQTQRVARFTGFPWWQSHGSNAQDVGDQRPPPPRKRNNMKQPYCTGVAASGAWVKTFDSLDQIDNLPLNTFAFCFDRFESCFQPRSREIQISKYISGSQRPRETRNIPEPGAVG